jgi:hypothetical protein
MVISNCFHSIYIHKIFKEKCLHTVFIGVNMAGGVTLLDPEKPPETENSSGNGLASKEVPQGIMLPLCCRSKRFS